jgi:hypothetical protein
MSLKAQLDACRRDYEANADPHVVDAEQRSIREPAETDLTPRLLIKAGELAPRFYSDAEAAGFSTFQNSSIAIPSSSGLSAAIGARSAASN